MPTSRNGNNKLYIQHPSYHSCLILASGQTLTSALRSERTLTTHLFTAIWKVKLMTPRIFNNASSQRPLRVWHWRANRWEVSGKPMCHEHGSEVHNTAVKWKIQSRRISPGVVKVKCESKSILRNISVHMKHPFEKCNLCGYASQLPQRCFCCRDSAAAHQRPSVCCNIIWLGESFLQSSIQVQSQHPAVQWVTFIAWLLRPPLHPVPDRHC